MTEKITDHDAHFRESGIANAYQFSVGCKFCDIGIGSIIKLCCCSCLDKSTYHSFHGCMLKFAYFQKQKASATAGYKCY